MAYLDDLKTSRDEAVTALKTILANPKPTYSIEGQSVSHADWVKTLLDTITQLNLLIAQSEPYCLTSQVL